jgi:hypothetical protein
VYSEGTRFEPHQGHRVPWDTSWFSSVHRHILGSYVHSVKHTSFHWFLNSPVPTVSNNLLLWIVFKCYGFITWLSLVLSGECRELFDPVTLFQIGLSLTELLRPMSRHRELVSSESRLRGSVTLLGFILLSREDTRKMSYDRGWFLLNPYGTKN